MKQCSESIFLKQSESVNTSSAPDNSDTTTESNDKAINIQGYSCYWSCITLMSYDEHTIQSTVFC